MTTREAKKRRKTIIIITVVLALDALIYYLTFVRGGINDLSSQLMYLPVIIAGVHLGLKAGMVSGFFSGLLIGPLMPVTLTLSNSKDLYFWLFRLVALLVTGILTGYLSDNYRINTNIIRSYETIAYKNLHRK